MLNTNTTWPLASRTQSTEVPELDLADKRQVAEWLVFRPRLEVVAGAYERGDGETLVVEREQQLTIIETQRAVARIPTQFRA